MMKIKDKVITLVDKAGIPIGTIGVIDEIDSDEIWVAVFIPADSDMPYDIVRYSREELQIQ